MKFRLLFVTLFTTACTTQKSITTLPVDNHKLIASPSGLQYTVLKAGTGDSVKVGNQVLIFETATYRDGTVLYTNENSNNPIKVLVGGHQATDGEDEGLRGMREGEIRKMIIPPYLCKRTSYPPNLSPDSTIVVKVILFKILTD